MTLLDGIDARPIVTDRLTIDILERTADDRATTPDQTVVLIDGNVSSSPVWQEIMHDLPHDLRVVAIELPDSAAADDLAGAVRATLTALDIVTAHIVGWSSGGDVAVRYAAEHPVLSLTLQEPLPVDAAAGLAVPSARVAVALDGPENAAEFRRSLLETIGYIGRRADPAPPTETIILSSWD